MNKTVKTDPTKRLWFIMPNIGPGICISGHEKEQVVEKIAQNLVREYPSPLFCNILKQTQVVYDKDKFECSEPTLYDLSLGQEVEVVNQSGIIHAMKVRECFRKKVNDSQGQMVLSPYEGNSVVWRGTIKGVGRDGTRLRAWKAKTA